MALSDLLGLKLKERLKGLAGGLTVASVVWMYSTFKSEASANREHKVLALAISAERDARRSDMKELRSGQQAIYLLLSGKRADAEREWKRAQKRKEGDNE